MTIRCTLCGAENEAAKKDTFIRCRLCDQVLDELGEPLLAAVDDTALPFEPVKAPSAKLFSLSGAKFFMLFVTLLALGLPWAFMAPLLLTPKSVAQSRSAYEDLRRKYAQDRTRWDEHKNQILATMKLHKETSSLVRSDLKVNDIPLEVLASFLVEDLGFDSPRFATTALYPDEALTSFILSKHEVGFWPLSITVSLEIALQNTERGLGIELKALRRGSKAISSDLAWDYFAAELGALRYFETFSPSVFSLELWPSGSEITEGANVSRINCTFRQKSI